MGVNCSGVSRSWILFPILDRFLLKLVILLIDKTYDDEINIDEGMIHSEIVVHCLT